jgi:hypothetical protein
MYCGFSLFYANECTYIDYRRKAVGFNFSNGYTRIPIEDIYIMVSFFAVILPSRHLDLCSVEWYDW